MKNVQKNVNFSGVGYILPLIAALATIPIMVKYLGIDLYGLYAICRFDTKWSSHHIISVLVYYVLDRGRI